MNVKIICLLAAVILAFGGVAFAAGAKSYEVTGTVLETTPTKIVVQKGAERWEIDLDPQTKVRGELKVGATVTITYVMSATKVEGSAAAAAETTPAVRSPGPTP